MRKSGEVFYKHSGMCVFEPSLLREHAMGLPKLSEHFNQTNSCRAVASMYSWGGGGGGVGQKIQNDEKNFQIFHGIQSHEDVCYPENEDAIYKQKYT